MPVPKRKTSKSRRDKRSANARTRMAVGAVMTCPTCQSPIIPHQVCRSCGHYKGVKVLKTKTDRIHERAQARRDKTQETPAPVVKASE